MNFKCFFNLILVVYLLIILPYFGMYPDMDIALGELIDEVVELGEDRAMVNDHYPRERLGSLSSVGDWRRFRGGVAGSKGRF